MTETAFILVAALSALEDTFPMAPKVSPILHALIQVYSTMQDSQAFVRELITKVNLFEGILAESTQRLQQMDSKAAKVDSNSSYLT